MTGDGSHGFPFYRSPMTGKVIGSFWMQRLSNQRIASSSVWVAYTRKTKH